MIKEIIQSLIGGYKSQNANSADNNGLPPQHTIIDEEMFNHSGVTYLAMRIRAPDELDYEIVGVVERGNIIVKDSGVSGVIRYVRIIDSQKVEGLVDILRKTGFKKEMRYGGEELYKLKS